MNDLFIKASRLKLRFASPKGPLAVEDLWDIPLSSATGKANLDAIAVGLHQVLKSDSNVSFVDAARKSDPTTQLAFDVVKHIIDVRLAENAAASAALATKERKQLLLGILERKQNEQLSNLSLDELRAEIDKL